MILPAVDWFQEQKKPLSFRLSQDTGLPFQIQPEGVAGSETGFVVYLLGDIHPGFARPGEGLYS